MVSKRDKSLTGIIPNQSQALDRNNNLAFIMRLTTISAPTIRPYTKTSENLVTLFSIVWDEAGVVNRLTYYSVWI